MNLGLLLIIIGILVAVFVHWGIGLVLIIAGVVLLVAPAV